jgi:hypothetical protein
MLELIRKHYADTNLLLEQLADAEWDAYRHRTHGESPHRELSDIWVRYNPIENFNGDMQQFNAEHVSQWYPVIAQIPEARHLSLAIAEDFGAKRLGAVLITKIPAHKQCYPHIDQGWHAQYYEKFALQIKGNKEQSFHVEDEMLRTQSGDLFWFDNAHTHWVLNPSDEDRITMIVCLRRH